MIVNFLGGIDNGGTTHNAPTLEMQVAICEENKSRWIQLETAEVRRLLRLESELSSIRQERDDWVNAYQSDTKALRDLNEELKAESNKKGGLTVEEQIDAICRNYVFATTTYAWRWLWASEKFKDWYINSAEGRTETREKRGPTAYGFLAPYYATKPNRIQP